MHMNVTTDRLKIATYNKYATDRLMGFINNHRTQIETIYNYSSKNKDWDRKPLKCSTIKELNSSKVPSLFHRYRLKIYKIIYFYQKFCFNLFFLSERSKLDVSRVKFELTSTRRRIAIRKHNLLNQQLSD
jgi:hypothetical protein